MDNDINTKCENGMMENESGNILSAFLFVGFLALICFISALVYFLCTEPVSIKESSEETLLSKSQVLYEMPSGEYEIISKLRSSVIHDNLFPFLTQDVTYYLIRTQTVQGEDIAIAARVSGNESESLEGGSETPLPNLYGKISQIEKDVATDARGVVQPIKVLPVCLNNSEGGIALRYVGGFVFIAFGLLFISSLFAIVRKPKQEAEAALDNGTRT